MTPAEILDLAHQGDPEAQYLQSLYCETGIEALPNLADAFRFCLQAANSGHCAAARRTAAMLEQGLGVPQDLTQAFHWYLRAAELGDVDSASSLGRIYSNGDGVEKSEAKALQWYEEGKKRGSPWALLALSSAYRFGELGQSKDESKADILGEQAIELIKSEPPEGVQAVIRKPRLGDLLETSSAEFPLALALAHPPPNLAYVIFPINDLS